MLAAAAALILALSAFAQEVETTGNLVLIGGGAKPPEAMRKFVELAGGPEALIVVFPTASAEEDTGDYYIELFAEQGCDHVVVADVHSSSDAADPETADTVRRAAGIFFAGGDQRRITAALLGTAVGDAVVEAYSSGAVIGGTSAGTACQSGLMITGDGDFSLLDADNVELSPGLGLFAGVIVDQHFVARRRCNRLISVVLEHPELIGVGIDEDTAVWVRPDNTFEVLGEGWVVVYDASKSLVTRRPREKGQVGLGVHGMVTWVLQPGETFDLTTRALVDVGDAP